MYLKEVELQGQEQRGFLVLAWSLVLRRDWVFIWPWLG